MKKQTQRIKPSKRPKKRYLLFEVRSSGELAENVKGLLVSHFKRFFGKDFEQKRIWVTSFYEQKGLGIVRCSHLAVEDLKKAIGAFSAVGGMQVKSRVLLASGSIKKLKQKIRNRA